MSNLSTLTVQLDANAAKLVRELGKAEKRTKKFGKNANKSLRAAAKGFGVLGAAATTALTLMVRNSLQSVDALAKVSDKLGITTKNLAGLQHAAKITGVEQNTLNKALVRQQKAIADANNGLETYARQFRKLGVDTQALAELNPAEQFKVVADALNKVENQTLKTSIAYDIFGGRATDLLNTMKFGTKGLNAFEEEAVALGIAVSRIDAAKIEAANDSIARAKAAFAGFSNKITVALAPAIELAANKMTDWLRNTGDVKGAVQDFIKQGIIGLGHFRNSLIDLEITFGSLERIALRTKAASYGVLGGLIPGRDGAEIVASIADQQLARLKDNTAELEAQKTTQAELNALADSFFSEANNRAAANLPATSTSSGGDVASTDISVQSNEAFKASLDEQLRMQLDAATAAGEGEAVIQAAFDQAKLENRQVTDQQILELARAQAGEIVRAEFEAEQLAKGDLGIPLDAEQKLELQQQIGDAQIELAKQLAARRAKIAAEEAKMLQKYDLTTTAGRKHGLSTLLMLQDSYGKKSRKMSIAMRLAENKDKIKQAALDTYAGVQATWAKWGYPMGIPFAGAQIAIGAANIASMSGLMGGGGGGGSISSAPGGSISDSGFAGFDSGDNDEPNNRQTAVTVVIHGNVIGEDEYVDNKLIPAIQNAVKDRDVVLVDADSRNGLDIIDAVPA